MEFQNSQPIFMQIVDHVCDMILRRELTADRQVPSVRELAVQLEVNPNTVMRAIERLSNAEIIYNKRGMGYYVATTAFDKVRTLRSRRLLEERLPRLADEILLLDMSLDDVTEALGNLMKSHS